MKDLPDYVSTERMVEVTVELPDGSTKKFNSGYEHVTFIDLREDGIWVRTENNTNLFYPFSRVLEMKLSSNTEPVSEDLQKQRRR